MPIEARWLSLDLFAMLQLLGIKHPIMLAGKLA